MSGDQVHITLYLLPSPSTQTELWRMAYRREQDAGRPLTGRGETRVTGTPIPTTVERKGCVLRTVSAFEKPILTTFGSKGNVLRAPENVQTPIRTTVESKRPILSAPEGVRKLSKRRSPENFETPTPTTKSKMPILLRTPETIENVGLTNFFPQKLSLRDAIHIREDTIKVSPNAVSKIYPFIILQKIMAFDSECRIELCLKESSKSVDDSDSDSESDESLDNDSVHPMDGLLALIHCSDNFLRQTIFSRLATCQIAVPLLLPHPDTRDPTLLMWALRAIVKEFKLPNGQVYNGRIIKYPAPFVSFLKIGSTNTSKSAILNSIMNVDSECKTITPFYDYDAPGGDNCRHLVKGLVEMSWYLPGDGLFPKPIAFTNLRGDASDPELQTQVKFLCRVSFYKCCLAFKWGINRRCYT